MSTYENGRRIGRDAPVDSGTTRPEASAPEPQDLDPNGPLPPMYDENVPIETLDPYLRPFAEEARRNMRNERTKAALKDTSYDEGLKGEMYRPQARKIEDVFYRASRRAAADMGRRGLGTSGMALNQQNDMAFSAAAQKAAASTAATDAARQARRTATLDEAGIYKDMDRATAERSALERSDYEAEQQRLIQLFSLGLGAI